VRLRAEPFLPQNNLQAQISTLRKVLGQSAFTTFPGRGYRFVLPVEGADPAVPATEPAGSSADVMAAASTSGRVRTNLPAQPLSCSNWASVTTCDPCR